MEIASPGVPATVGAAPPAPRSASAEHIRGSSLLLAGRMVAQALEFASQILIVLYLSKADYGAFSYALSIVTLCKGVAVYALPDTLSRFLPLYRERKQYGAILGSVVLAFGVVAGLGLLIAGGINAGVGLLGIRPVDDARALTLLMILALVIPLEGLDGLITALFAVFANARMIFFRQMLGPGLRTGTLLALVAFRVDVVTLATGYLAISLLGMVLYAGMFVRLWRGGGFVPRMRLPQISFPIREIFGFATPLLASTLVWLLMESSDALLLGFFQNTEAVANFRAVLPVARLNQGVILTFALLYTPLAARLYARNEHRELADLYWQTALWMTVLSFPVLVLTGSFSRSVTQDLLGSRYVDSAPIMALLSLGYFFHTSLGFNGLTVKIYGKLRYTVAVDCAAAALNVAVNLLLIPQWGPFGAAIGTAGTMIVHNLLKQFGLWRYTGISLFHGRYALAYGALFGTALGLWALQTLLPASLAIAVPVGAGASLGVLWCSRRALQIDTIFPELLAWPIVGTLMRVLKT